jgi:hypothetical protein
MHVLKGANRSRHVGQLVGGLSPGVTCRGHKELRHLINFCEWGADVKGTPVWA